MPLLAGLRSPPDIWSHHAELRKLDYEPLLVFGERPRTLYLRLETVNTCNNECTICAYRDQDRPKKIMPMPVLEKAVGDYVAMGGGYISLTPLVGDVFMDRYLIQRLKFLRGVPEISGIGFTTNGAMAHRFDDPTLSDLLSAVTRIGISIYGISPDEYFEITRRKTYAKMKEGIRRIVSLSRVPVSLEFRLFERRTREEVCDWLRSEVFSADEYERLSDKVQVNSIITDYANWGVYDSDNTPLSHDATWFPSVRQERRPQCLIPIFAFLVFSNGSVSFCPCDNFNDVKELRIGNVMDSSLADIYASERVRDLWDWDRCGTPEFCKGCSFHIPLSILDHSPTILTDPHQIVGAG